MLLHSLYFLCALLFSSAISHLPNSSPNVTVIDVSAASSLLKLAPDDSLVVLRHYAATVLLGGRNSLYNISLPSLGIISRYDWKTTEKARSDCEKILSSDCDNFVRTFYETGTQFVACGSHGLSPKCALFDFGYPAPRRLLESGKGLAPFLASEKAPFLYTNQRLFTVNAAEYSASSSLLLRKDTRLSDKSAMMRTARGEEPFDGARFVDVMLNGEEVLTLFTESPSEGEGCGLRRVARVGRVCANDRGTSRYPDEWSSFVKARLECGIAEDGQDTLHFNQLLASGSSSSQIFGSFRSQLAGIGGSAVCIYGRDDISKNLSSVFRHQKGGCARAANADEQTAIRSRPLVNNKVVAAPAFVHYGPDHFTAISLQENVTDLAGRSFSILFLGTNLGRVFKVVLDGKTGKTTHVATLMAEQSSMEVISLWSHRVRLPNQQTETSLVIVNNSTIVRLPSAGCEQVSSCTSCLSMGDPTCAWIRDGAQCVTVEHNLLRRTYLTQKLEECPVKRPVKEKPAPASLPCLCEKSEPCPDHAIGKPLPPTIAELAEQWNNQNIYQPALFIFVLGLTCGAIISFGCSGLPFHQWISRIPCGKSSGKCSSSSKDSRQIDAYANPRPTRLRSNDDDPMRTSIQTYC